MGISSPVHLIFIAAVALIVLGPKRLPELARTLGKAMQEFRDAMSQGAVGEGHPPHEAPQGPPARHGSPADPGLTGRSRTEEQPPS